MSYCVIFNPRRLTPCLRRLFYFNNRVFISILNDLVGNYWVAFDPGRLLCCLSWSYIFLIAEIIFVLNFLVRSYLTILSPRESCWWLFRISTVVRAFTCTIIDESRLTWVVSWESFLLFNPWRLNAGSVLCLIFDSTRWLDRTVAFFKIFVDGTSGLVRWISTSTLRRGD